MHRPSESGHFVSTSSEECDLYLRVSSEYREMPGLSLTVPLRNRASHIG